MKMPGLWDWDFNLKSPLLKGVPFSAFDLGESRRRQATRLMLSSLNHLHKYFFKTCRITASYVWIKEPVGRSSQSQRKEKLGKILQRKLVYLKPEEKQNLDRMECFGPILDEAYSRKMPVQKKTSCSTQLLLADWAGGLHQLKKDLPQVKGQQMLVPEGWHAAWRKHGSTLLVTTSQTAPSSSLLSMGMKGIQRQVQVQNPGVP